MHLRMSCLAQLAWRNRWALTYLLTTKSWFDTWSGNVPGSYAWFPGVGSAEGSQSMISLIPGVSFALFFSLLLRNKKRRKKEKKKEWAVYVYGGSVWGLAIGRQCGAETVLPCEGFLCRSSCSKVKALWISKTLSRESMASSRIFCGLEHWECRVWSRRREDWIWCPFQVLCSLKVWYWGAKIAAWRYDMFSEKMRWGNLIKPSGQTLPPNPRGTEPHGLSPVCPLLCASLKGFLLWFHDSSTSYFNPGKYIGYLSNLSYNRAIIYIEG